MKCNLYWQCPVCDREHNWYWNEEDCICGPIHVNCNKCNTEFKGEFVWIEHRDFEIAFPSSYKENNMNRDYVVLQQNDDASTNVVGVYTDDAVAEKVREKCMLLYNQYYYIEDVVLDVDNVGK
jgi:hypothetical protein